MSKVTLLAAVLIFSSLYSAETTEKKIIPSKWVRKQLFRELVASIAEKYPADASLKNPDCNRTNNIKRTVDCEGELGSNDEYNGLMYAIYYLYHDLPEDQHNPYRGHLEDAKKLCSKLAAINAIMGNDITSQKISSDLGGWFVKTTFIEGNHLEPLYVYQLFKNAFPRDVRIWGGQITTEDDLPDFLKQQNNKN